MRKYIRVNQTPDYSFETVVTCQKEENEIIVLCQEKDWSYDIIGYKLSDMFGYKLSEK